VHTYVWINDISRRVNAAEASDYNTMMHLKVMTMIDNAQVRWGTVFSVQRFNYMHLSINDKEARLHGKLKANMSGTERRAKKSV